VFILNGILGVVNFLISIPVGLILPSYTCYRNHYEPY
jgi:hypothetical protein